MGIFSKRPKEALQVKAIFNGETVKLETLKDGVFSEKMMGDGVVLKPLADAKKVDVFAPISGTLLTVFPTGHAYGIKSNEGTEILIHLGIDTVNLNGKGFEVAVKQGSKIKAGEKMGTMDVAHIRKNAPSADAIIIVTSGNNISDTVFGKVKTGDTILTI